MKLWLRKSKSVTGFSIVALVMAGGFGSAYGQRKCPQYDYVNAPSYPMKTIYLHNLTQATDGNEILTGIRLMADPQLKVYLVPSENAIVVHGCQEDVDLAEKLIAELDKPRKNYRLTYTITEMDGAKRLGVQHVTLIVQNGQRMVLKNGSKVPIVTGSLNQSNASVEQQMTYLDIGLSFDATVSAAGGTADQLSLKTRVEQSSVAEEKSGVGPQDPVVRQSTLEGTTTLTAGKTQVLGSFDVTASTRHIEIEVMAELVK